MEKRAQVPDVALADAARAFGVGWIERHLGKQSSESQLCMVLAEGRRMEVKGGALSKRKRSLLRKKSVTTRGSGRAGRVGSRRPR